MNLHAGKIREPMMSGQDSFLAPRSRSPGPRSIARRWARRRVPRLPT